MRKLKHCLIALPALALACGQEPEETFRELRVEVELPAGTESIRAGTLGSQGTLTVDPTALLSVRSSAPSLSFGEGCLLLGLAGVGSPRAQDLARVGPSVGQSLSGQTISFSGETLQLEPLVAARYLMPSGAEVTVRSALGIGEVRKPDWVKVEEGHVTMRCVVREVDLPTASVAVVGAGSVDLGGGFGPCRQEGGPSCARVVEGDRISFRATPDVPGTEISVEGCSVFERKDLGPSVRFETEVGACVVRFGSPHWFVRLIISESLRVGALPDGVRYDPVLRQFSVENSLERAVVALRDAEGNPLELNSAAGPCAVTPDGAGELELFRAGAVRDCLVGVSEAFTLDVADSELPLTVRPGPSSAELNCPVVDGTVSSCTNERGQELAVPIVYAQPTEVELETMVVARLNFGGDCLEKAPGVARVRVDAARSCTVRQNAQGEGRLRLQFPEAWGQVRVSAPGLEELCDARASRVCLVEALPGTLALELLSDDGTTRPVRIGPVPAASLGSDDVQCGVVEGERPGEFTLDPVAAANASGVVPPRATHRCAVEFACTDTATFEGATVQFRSEGALVAEKHFRPMDCDRAGTCSDAQPVKLPPGELTAELLVEGTGDATALDVRAGGDPLSEPRGFFLDSSFVPFGAPFSVAEVQVFSAAASVCRNGPRERLNLSFLLHRGE